MKDSKLIDVLKTFTPDEFKDFEKFIMSPYFRKRDVTGLFEVLKRFYPDFSDKNLIPEYVFDKLFPGKKFENQKADSLVRTLTSDLFLSCKEFLIHLEMNNQQSFRESFLLSQLRKRNLDKEFIREAAAINNKKEKGTKELVFDFLERSYICSAEAEFCIDKNEFENGYEKLIKQSEFLSASAILRGLKFIDQKISAEDGYNLKTRYNLVDNFIKHLNLEPMIAEMKEYNDFFTPYIEIYYTVNLLKHSDDEKVFFKLKELVLKHEQLLPHSDIYMLYSILSSFCNKMDNQIGKTEFRKENFEIFSSMLRLGVYKYSAEDYFQIGLFRGMLITSRSCGEFKWMKDLIDNYSHELHPDYAENMKYYSLGQYYFALGENEKALESLIRLKSDYFLYKKDLKNLMFRIYYNLGYYEEAFSVLDSLKHYLSSTKDLSENIKKLTGNFVKFSTQLLKIKTGAKSENADYLIKNISNEKYTESHGWLLEKAKELKL